MENLESIKARQQWFINASTTRKTIALKNFSLFIDTISDEEVVYKCKYNKKKIALKHFSLFIDTISDEELK
jgi:hypothetical protein